MKMHMLIRRFAGAFILASLLLAHYHGVCRLQPAAIVVHQLLPAGTDFEKARRGARRRKLLRGRTGSSTTGKMTTNFP
jgi:hypothetical protein